jgi:hypothetical protein
MQHHATSEFWQESQKLPLDIQRRANKQFSLMKSDIDHHSLQFKKIGDRQGHEIWSARVTLSYRALAMRRGYGFFPDDADEQPAEGAELGL